MGRSVSYPSGAIVAFTLLEVDDEEDWDFEYEWLRADLSERAAAAFPSLEAHDGWRGREDRILGRNAFADFGVSVYGGLVAVWVVERDDGAYWDDEWRTARSPRAQQWLRQIAPRFNALFGDYDCLGHMSNGEGVYRKRAARHRAGRTSVCTAPPDPGGTAQLMARTMRERPWASRRRPRNPAWPGPC